MPLRYNNNDNIMYDIFLMYPLFFLACYSEKQQTLSNAIELQINAELTVISCKPNAWDVHLKLGPLEMFNPSLHEFRNENLPTRSSIFIY